MAIAKTIGEVEPKQLDWLEVVDEDGMAWRYNRGDAVDSAFPAHVNGQPAGTVIRAVLVRDKEGKVILRQDGDGLPNRIVVNYISDWTDRGATASGWFGKVQYEQVA